MVKSHTSSYESEIDDAVGKIPKNRKLYWLNILHNTNVEVRKSARKNAAADKHNMLAEWRYLMKEMGNMQKSQQRF